MLNKAVAMFGAGLLVNMALCMGGEKRPTLGPTAAPEGIALWTVPPLETIAWTYSAPPVNTPRPIRMVGARNGTYSGRVVLSSAGAIRNLKASVGDLAQAGGQGRIPAAATQLRWTDRATPEVSWVGGENPVRSVRFDRLLSEFPKEITPVDLWVGEQRTGPRATVPIWLTVRVPADAPAGDYGGTLAVEAEGAKPVKFSVPVELRIHDWRVPDPKDFTIHHNIYQSPDSVAQYYKVPLWSDKHWELMGRSLEVIAQVGNKLCVAPLVEKGMAINNTQSMIRWIKKPDGSYEQDYSILEKYLDLYAAKCGKPGVLALTVWERELKTDGTRFEGPPLGVTAFDPATGKTETLRQPEYLAAENQAFWKPIFIELRKRLEKRGWFDVAAVAHAAYSAVPSPKAVTLYKGLWPDGRWIHSAHSFVEMYVGADKAADRMPVMCCEWVWGAGSPIYNPDNPKEKRTAYPRPWKPGYKCLRLANVRYFVEPVHKLIDESPLILHRAASEGCLQCDLHGIGRVGADFWPIPGNKPGKYYPICDSYGGCSMPDSTMAMTSPGPDGAVFNERLEMFREGVQIAEAIIFVQRALDGGKLDAELAKRATAFLDERARFHIRSKFNTTTEELPVNWADMQDRDGRLFALCAEVAKAGK
jgi:hypothetical protein